MSDMHKAYVTDDGRIVCKDTCPRDDCVTAMQEWNNNPYPSGDDPHVA